MGLTMATLTKKQFLENEMFKNAPDDAKIVFSYIDFWGDNHCMPTIFYNEYSNIVYLSPGDSIEEE